MSHRRILRAEFAATAVLCGIVACLVAATEARSSQRDPGQACSTSHLYLANADARIFRVGPEGDLFLCRRGGRRAAALVGLRNPRNPSSHGSFNMRLAGPFASYQVAGEGCATGSCAGPVAYVVDARRPSDRQRLSGAVDLVVRSDGAYAAMYRIDPAAPSDFGAQPGPGPFRLVTRDAVGRTVVQEGTDLQPGSLTLRDSRVYWLRDGQAQTALLR